MFRTSRFVLILALCCATGCQGARFWKKSDGQAARDKAATKSNSATAKKDSEKSRFSFARLTSRKTDEDEKESDQAEPLIAEQQLDLLVQQGQQALEKNDLETARQAYREILLLDPAHAAANHGLAMAADLERRWKDAEYHYLQALKAKPGDANILSDLGYSCLLQRRFAEAERYLNQALEADPQHENARVNLALLDLQQGRADAAEQRIVDLYGDTARAAEMMSQLQYQATEASGNQRQQSESAEEYPEVSSELPFEQVQELARQQREASLRRRMQDNAGRPIPQAAGWPAGALNQGPEGSTHQYPESGWPVQQQDGGMPSMPPLDSRDAAQARYRGQWPTAPANARSVSWNQPQSVPASGRSGFSGSANVQALGYGAQQAVQPSSWVQPAPYPAAGGYPAGGMNQAMPGGMRQGQTPPVAPVAPVQTGSPVPIRSGRPVAPGAQSYGEPAGMQIRGVPQGGIPGWEQAGSVGPQAGYSDEASRWENLPVEGLNAGPGNLFPVYGDQSAEGVQPAGYSGAGPEAAAGLRMMGGAVSGAADGRYYGPPRSVLAGQELSDQMSAQAAQRAAQQGGYDVWPEAAPAVAPMQAYDLQRESIHQQYRGMQQSQRPMNQSQR